MSTEEARAITQLGIRPGQDIDITMQWSGKRGDPRIYHVSLADAPLGPQRNGTFAVPASPAIPPASAESDLEYELRMSVEVERIKQQIAERKTKRDAAGSPKPAAPPLTATPADLGRQPRQIATQHDTTPVNGRGETWLQIVNGLSKELIGCYMDVLAWAREEYGSEARPEDVRALVTTAFINTRRSA